MSKLSLLAVLGLVFFVGCGGTLASKPGASAGTVTTTPAADVEVTVPDDSMLVLVKMPAMTCEGCAGNVRKDLIKVDGIKILALDPKNNMAKLAVGKDSKLDVKAELDELAKTNSNIEGFEIVEKTN
ncbi:MAG: hypothetical protein U0894_01605 [Pirellulales bacterium]